MVQPHSEIVDVNSSDAEEGVRRFVDAAVRMGASDLFYVANEHAVTVQVRHLGKIHTIGALNPEQGRRHMQHIKARASMDLAEKRRPLDGRWIFEKDDGELVDLRINTIPTHYGEDFAIRLLDRNAGLFTLEQTGMHPEQLELYTKAIDSPGGLILVTGATGSGKTATLYATLQRLNDGTRKIHTIEDPIEFIIEGVRQSQVHPAIDLGFAELLRAVLRQSADVIMIGEIRDEETAQAAILAANSGILVLATMHAAGPSSSVLALRNMGVNSHYLAASLRCVVGQRLVRLLCEHCRRPANDNDPSMDLEPIKPWLKDAAAARVYSANGCGSCQQGYVAQTGVFEVMPISRDLRAMIVSGSSAREIRDRAVHEKMMQLREAALLKVAHGLTTTEEVFRILANDDLLTEVHG